jgi:hypothetical protein
MTSILLIWIFTEQDDVSTFNVRREVFTIPLSEPIENQHLYAGIRGKTPGMLENREIAIG